MTHYVYIIECSNDSYYTGYTTDLKRRYQEHEKGTEKCRYTRSFTPKKLAAFWIFDSKSQALRVELQIKKLKKHQKKSLIDQARDDDFFESLSLITRI